MFKVLAGISQSISSIYASASVTVDQAIVHVVLSQIQAKASLAVIIVRSFDAQHIFTSLASTSAFTLFLFKDVSFSSSISMYQNLFGILISDQSLIVSYFASEIELQIIHQKAQSSMYTLYIALKI
jgi:hypothetical protein